MSRSDPTTFGSFLRTAIAGLVVGGIGYAGGWIYTTFSPNIRLQQAQLELDQTKSALHESNSQIATQQQAIHQLDEDLQASRLQVEQLNTSMGLLKVNRRIAEIMVLQQIEDPQTGSILTEFAFQEIDEDGNPLDHARTFRIAGDVLYVDFWVVKFEDEFVEVAAVDKSTSICLFRRLFGEFQEPHEGYTLDAIGERPNVYGNQPMSDFEKSIWDNFWIIANDPARAAEIGIRAAHGEAVATKLQRGQRYRVTLRASDGLSITPVRQLPSTGEVS